MDSTGNQSGERNKIIWEEHDEQVCNNVPENEIVQAENWNEQQYAVKQGTEKFL